MSERTRGPGASTGDKATGARQLELERGADIASRLLDFASECLFVAKSMPRDVVGRHVTQQLVRSATGAGANYEEARGAESSSEALKEVREARYWLQLSRRAKIAKVPLDAVIAEALELAAILGASKKTAIENRSEQAALARARGR